MVAKNPRFGWCVRYEGKRGGRWQTVPTTEEAARERFAKFKPSDIATLGEIRPMPVFGSMFETKEETAAVKLRMCENLIKDHKKKLARTQTAIEFCQKKIRELKQEIKQAKKE